MKCFSFLSIFLILNCGRIQGQSTTRDKPFSISFDANHLSNPKEIGLKDIAEDIKYVKLEYKPESALGRIQRFVATEKFFFVFDNRDISQFSRSGKYVRKIGKMGRGPGEYPGMRDFAVDESTQRLFILANFTRQIFIYDFNGNYLNNIKLNSEEREKIDITKDGLIVLQTHPITKSLLSVEIINQHGESLLKFNSRCYLTSSQIKLAKTPNISFYFNNYLFFKEGINDTIYKISSGKITPYFTYNLGKDKPPLSYAYEERAKYIEISNICESDKYIVTFFFTKGLIGTAVYNKTTKETTINLPEDKLKNGLKNDIDNGINFFLTSVPFTLKSNQKEWLQVLEPNKLNDYKNDKKMSGNFKTLIEDFKDDDNPVIMVIRVK